MTKRLLIVGALIAVAAALPMSKITGSQMLAAQLGQSEGTEFSMPASCYRIPIGCTWHDDPTQNGKPVDAAMEQKGCTACAIGENYENAFSAGFICCSSAAPPDEKPQHDLVEGGYDEHSCEEYSKAAHGSDDEPYHLLLKAVADFNSDLYRVKCISVKTKVGSGDEILSMTITGWKSDEEDSQEDIQFGALKDKLGKFHEHVKKGLAKGLDLIKDKVSEYRGHTSVKREIQIERLRSGNKEIEPEKEVGEDGKVKDVPDVEKEEARYRVISKKDVTGKATLAEQALEEQAELQLDADAERVEMPTYSTGYIRESDEEWAQMRQHEASPEELLQVSSTWDERTDTGRTCKGYAIVDQGSCGSCWAFAAGRVYNDRICRKSEGRNDVALSEQDITSCWYSTGGFYTSTVSDNGISGLTQLTEPGAGSDPSRWSARDGCDGGSASSAWMIMALDGGRVSRWADPYTGQGYQSDACGSVDRSAIKYKVKSDSRGIRVFTLPSGDITKIKHAIYSGGSVSAGFTVFQCVMQHRGWDLYDRSSNSQSGGHAVAVIGYGSNYWIIANSWGTSWGEGGYARFKHNINGIGFEERMSYPDPELPTSCANAAPCQNGGEMDGTCNCRCNQDAQWSGRDCGSCSATCQNGGAVVAASCSCQCAPGYFGNQCQNYVLLSWLKRESRTGTIRARWNIQGHHSGSKFERMAAPTGENGDNIRITGSTVTGISGDAGSKDFTVNLGSYIPGYPSGWHYVFYQSQGTNEFGASRGFKEVPMPSLKYENSCFSGGHQLDGATGLCSDPGFPTMPPAENTPPAATGAPRAPAATGAPRAPAATGTPVAPATRAPTTPPTRSPTNPPVSSGGTDVNGDTCRYAKDGECDETQYCAAGTDCTDCGTCGAAGPVTREPTTRNPTNSPVTRSTYQPTRAPTRASTPTPVVDTRAPTAAATNDNNSCRYANDNECDEPTYCSVGTDCQDCGNCPGKGGEPAPVSCNDVSSTGITLNGSPATCTQLQAYCTHSQYGSMIRTKCPATCNAC